MHRSDSDFITNEEDTDKEFSKLSSCLVLPVQKQDKIAGEEGSQVTYTAAQ